MKQGEDEEKEYRILINDLRFQKEDEDEEKEYRTIPRTNHRRVIRETRNEEGWEYRLTISDFRRSRDKGLTIDEVD
jgi:hypothetical protein